MPTNQVKRNTGETNKEKRAFNILKALQQAYTRKKSSIKVITYHHEANISSCSKSKKRKRAKQKAKKKNQNFGGEPQSKKRSATIKIHDPSLTTNNAWPQEEKSGTRL